MATNQRIYKVTSLNTSYLVQATSQAQALRHVAGKEYQIEVAKALDVAQLMAKGATVEIAATVAEQLDLLTEGEQA
jgi:hypothetical protein